MGVASMHGRTLRASLCEIEHGVFYATYPESDCDPDELVVYHVGTSAVDAKKRIEASARALGYEIRHLGSGDHRPAVCVSRQNRCSRSGCDISGRSPGISTGRFGETLRDDKTRLHRYDGPAAVYLPSRSHARRTVPSVAQQTSVTSASRATRRGNEIPAAHTHSPGHAGGPVGRLSARLRSAPLDGRWTGRSIFVRSGPARRRCSPFGMSSCR